MAKSRIIEEKRIVRQMIGLYCRHHHSGKELCKDCRSLADYCDQRLVHCKFGESKTTCKKCPVHCYKPDMRERIREVMRYSGPRMLFLYPIETLKHYLHV